MACRGEDVAVCTIEKANVAINRLVQQSRLDSLCCVIVDVSPQHHLPSSLPCDQSSPDETVPPRDEAPFIFIESSVRLVKRVWQTDCMYVEDSRTSCDL